MQYGKSKCDNTSVPQDIIYQAITQILQELKRDEDSVLDNFMKSAEEVINNTGYETEMLDVQNQINQLNSELKSLRTMRRRNEITEEEFMEDADEIRENIQALNKAYETLEASNSLASNKKDKMILLKETLKKELDNIECTDEIIKGLVKKIVVHSRENIEIHLSGDIEANLAFGKNLHIPECTTLSVLLNTYVYDFSWLLPASKVPRDLYNNITFTVYVHI
jgi:chromosome segregation ATPase